MKFKSHLIQLFCILSIICAPHISHARSFEMLGSFNYSFPYFSPKPTTYQNKGGGIGYGFAGRMELGPGMLETGFTYIPFSMTTQETAVATKFSGSYWAVPLLYRYFFLEPYFSIAAGFDYAIEGGTQISTATGALNTTSSGSFQSHFGTVASFEVKQDIGENLSVFLDLRYRMGLSDAIRYQSTSTGTTTGVKSSFGVISLGVIKHLED